MPGHDLAVLTRETGDEIALQEAVVLGGNPEMQPTYWRTLLSLLFAAGPLNGGGSEATSAKLAAIGIDATLRARLAEQIRPETSALLVLVNRPAIRDTVLGVLCGLFF